MAVAAGRSTESLGICGETVGYLIAGHFLKQRPEPAKVRAALPSSVGFMLYRHTSHPIYAIDTFRAAKPSKYAFSTATPATEIPLDVSPELDALYEQLRSENAANGFKRSYLNLSRSLSAALDGDVLTIFADDDGNDFDCLTRRGEVLSGAARCDPYIVKFAPSPISKERGAEQLSLHQLAAKAFTSFVGVSASEIGFGSFDAPENLGFRVATDA